MNMQYQTELRSLITQVMSGLIPLAIERKSFVINDIQPDIEVYADKDILALAMADVLVKALKHTENDCIRISAKVFNNIILLTIKETSHRPHTTIAFSMEQVQPLAEKLGGSISVNSDDDKCITVAFTFFNGKRAA